MNKLLFSIGFILFLVFSDISQASDKIAVVNISNIFQNLLQRVSVAKKLENEFKDRIADLQKQEHELQTKMQLLQRDRNTMKDSEHSFIEKEIISQRKLLNSKAQAFEQDNRRRQMEESNKLLGYIQDAVKKVATNDGYDVVIDASAIAYASNVKDITSKVLKQVK